MINLLNPADKSELKAARINVRLRRFTVLTLLALVAVGGIYAFSFKSVEDEKSNAASSNSTASQQLKAFDAVKTSAKAYQANLAIAKKIFGSEVTFSKFLTDLSQTLPSNTILQDLTLSQSAGDSSGKATATQISARAKSYEAVIALKTSLEKRTDMFSEVRITSTALSEARTEDPLTISYPYVATFSVVLAQQGAAK